MKQLIALTFLLISVSCNTPFAGKVIYKNSYESKLPNITSAELEEYLGTTRELYLQGAFYKNVYYGKTTSMVLYRGDVNRLYEYEIDGDTILYQGAKNDSISTVSKYSIEESNEVILGMKCKKIIIHSKLGTSTYYFSDRYPINPKDFKDHNFNFWNLYTSLSKAIPLKIIFEGKDVNLTSVATEIEGKALPNNLFAVPDGYLKEKF